MSIFIDTGVFVAFHNTRDRNHSRAVELLKQVASGEYGSVYTSDYVFNEAVTLALMRTKKPIIATAVGELILGNPPRISPFINLLRVTEDVFAKSWELFKRYMSKGLSFTDCTTVTLMKQTGIKNLLSFDRSFNGIVRRLS